MKMIAPRKQANLTWPQGHFPHSHIHYQTHYNIWYIVTYCFISVLFLSFQKSTRGPALTFSRQIYLVRSQQRNFAHKLQHLFWFLDFTHVAEKHKCLSVSWAQITPCPNFKRHIRTLISSLSDFITQVLVSCLFPVPCPVSISHSVPRNCQLR